MPTVLDAPDRLTHAVIMASTIGENERRLLSLCRRVGLTSRIGDVSRWRQTARERSDRALGRTVCLDRIGSAAQARTVFDACADAGARCVNPPGVLALCTDQQALAAALHAAQVATPSSGIAMSAGAAVSLARQIGYPLVIRVDTGHWTRWSLHVADEAALRSALTGGESDAGLPRHVYRLQSDAAAANEATQVNVVVVGGRVVNARRNDAAEPVPWEDVSNLALQDCAEAVTHAVGSGTFTIEAIVDDAGQMAVRDVHRHIDLCVAGATSAIDEALCAYLDATVSAAGA